MNLNYVLTCFVTLIVVTVADFGSPIVLAFQTPTEQSGEPTAAASGDVDDGDDGDDGDDSVDPLAEVLEGHSYHGGAFNEGARQAARIIGGTGKVSFDVTTESETAKRFIVQGIGQLHGFWDLEAERSFRQAAVLDPDCAIAYWGAALATLESPERASDFINEAVKRIDGVSDRERQYITALDKFFHGERKKKSKKTSSKKSDYNDGESDSEPDAEAADEVDTEKADTEKADTDSTTADEADAAFREKNLVSKKNRKGRSQKYLNDLESIALDYPDDLEAKALIVHRIWYNSRAGIPVGSHIAAEALLKEIFSVNPMHPAHHYRIHLWDRRKPEMALQSAGLCGLSAPSIAHMWHMPGHIFSRLHRFDEAVYYQEASARVDHQHMIRDFVIPDEIHNYAHNNEWLARNLVFLGRATDALALAKNLVELPRHPRFNSFDEKERGSAIYGQSRLLQVLREFQLRGAASELSANGYFDELDAAQQIDVLRLLGCFAALDRADEETTMFRGELSDLLSAAESELATSKERIATLKWMVDKDREKPPAEAGATEPLPKLDRESIGEQLSESNKRKDKAIAQKDSIERALKAIDGYAAVATHDYKTAVDKLKSAGKEDDAWIGELVFLGGDTKEGLQQLRKQVDKRTGESLPLARLAWCLFQNGETDAAKEQFLQLREQAIGADLSAEVFRRLDPLAKLAGFDAVTDQAWPIAVAEPYEKAAFRPSLESLGPVHWTPPVAPQWQARDSNNSVVSNESYAGENYLLIFYLGHGCLHCAEQLQAFGPRVADFENAGIKMVAISSDDNAGLTKSLDNYNGKMPMRLASNSQLDIFKSFRAHDDFENQPLHGTFLIDGDGRIRWQDISYEPFMDHDFLLQESQRLLKIGNGMSGSASSESQFSAADR